MRRLRIRQESRLAINSSTELTSFTFYFLLQKCIFFFDISFVLRQHILNVETMRSFQDNLESITVSLIVTFLQM